MCGRNPGVPQAWYGGVLGKIASHIISVLLVDMVLAPYYIASYS